jgi:rsbT co-antagonist protein RsbR
MPDLAAIVATHRDDLLSEWVRVQEDPARRRADVVSDIDLNRESRDFLGLFASALAEDDVREIGGPGWAPVRAFLSDLARRRAAAGVSAAETARFMFTLKEPLFARLSNEFQDDAVGLIAAILETTELVDQLGLLTIDEYAKAR